MCLLFKEEPTVSRASHGHLVRSRRVGKADSESKFLGRDWPDSPGSRHDLELIAPLPVSGHGGIIARLSSLHGGSLARHRRYHVARMDHSDAGIPREIPIVEREQLRDSLRQHRGDQPGVVHLDTRHRVRDDEPAPFRMNPFVVRQEPESAFKQRRSFVGLGRRQAETVVRYPASAHVPELDQILRSKAKALPLGREGPHGFSNQNVFRVIRLDEAQQDVCVCQDCQRDLSRGPGRCSRG